MRNINQMPLKTSLLLTLSSCLLGCAVNNIAEEKFALPDELFGTQAEDNLESAVFHPAFFLESLSLSPANDCEKEKLRQLVIAVNMYSEEYHNQTYYTEVSSPGIQILFEAFPSLSSIETSGRGELSIDNISHHLRRLEFDC